MNVTFQVAISWGGLRRESAFRDMNAAVQRTVGTDFGTLLPLALAVLGIRSLLVSEKLLSPSWHDYLWFSFSTYFILNRTNPPE